MFTAGPNSNAHISPIGAVPKKNKPGKWHLIMDLSSPKGSSVNDGVDPAWATLNYVTVDHLASLILHPYGPRALLVKADVKEAYRVVPVHPKA